jgi:Fe-S-cluster-containing hydrogenase component 2
MSLLNIFKNDSTRHTVLSSGHVVSESSRCVQCGICSYNCPIGIDVRAHVWRDECVARCPRGVLRFAQTDLFVRREE